MEREVCVFFYGSDMNRRVLDDAGFKPSAWQNPERLSMA